MRTPLDPDAVDDYLRRLDLDPAAVRSGDRDVETLARLQAAHVRHVPFENLSIVGDPAGEAPVEGVRLDVAHLHEKVVDRGRGGFCYELNGLFAGLLDALGFDVDRVAAMVLDDDGTPQMPANHMALVVSLDRRYVVDPGHGWPQMATPTPLDGDPTAVDGAGVAWRVVDSGRPDCPLAMQCRVRDDEWASRYVFGVEPRALSYFEATCDYLATAPESWFTTNAVVRTRTPEGWRRLSHETLTRVEGGERSERPVDPDEWHRLLDAEFGIALPG